MTAALGPASGPPPPSAPSHSPRRPRPPSSSSSPSGPVTEFVSADLNVQVRGRIVAPTTTTTANPDGPIEGITLELESHEGIVIKYPQLVSVRIRPEEQTLWSINTGERLLTLATPLLPPEDDDGAEPEQGAGSSSAIDDDEEDDDPSPKTDPPGNPSRRQPRPVIVTLHAGLLPASETDHLQSSPLYSSAFNIVIDAPSFPPPHLDPAASVAPSTPAVRPHDAGAAAGSSSSSSSLGLPGGGMLLNSPTIQRALLSPLLSPQRRASSQQGSDASVPPLSLGLSRTSRGSFSAADRPTTTATASPSPARRGLAALWASPSTGPAPASAPAPPTLAGTLTTALSTAAKRTAEELIALRRAHDAFVRRAKAELELLEARIEGFDPAGEPSRGGSAEDGVVVRGFRARGGGDAERRDDVQQGVDERAGSQSRRRSVVVDAGGGSVSRSRDRERGRGRDRDRDRTPFADVVEGERHSSASPSRERRPVSLSRAGVGSNGNGNGGSERAAGPPPTTRTTTTSTSQNNGRATGKDEDMSSRIRAQDEREEDQRGRSRSRARRGEPAGNSSSSATGGLSSATLNTTQQQVGTASQRSRSRSKALAEATAKALEGASAAAAPAAGDENTHRERAHEPPPSSNLNAEAESRSRGRAPRKGENIPATLEEEDEDEIEDEPEARGRNGRTATPREDARGHPPAGGNTNNGGFLSPASAAASAGRGANHAGSTTGPSSTTPTFLQHQPGQPLVAIPESEEFAAAGAGSPHREDTERPLAGRNERGPKERQKGTNGAEEEDEEEEENQPFEMDEDVDVDDLDLSSPQPRLIPFESPSIEVAPLPPLPPSGQQQSAISSSFRPGSFQRASALSASYNALLATASPKMRASPNSPAAAANVGLPASPSVNATRAYGSPVASRGGAAATLSPAPTTTPIPPKLQPTAGGLPQFSPPDADHPTATSAREDAQAALAAATLEHTRLGGGSDVGDRDAAAAAAAGRPTGPDPRDVRRGEQKIRDVLAMDVPSHRPLHAVRRRSSVGTPNAAAYQADDDGSDGGGADSAHTSEAEEVDEEEEVCSGTAAGLAMSGMTSPRTGPVAPGHSNIPGSAYSVGSLPIALGRPSAVHAARSSWRPDPEREWAQARRERKTSLAQGRESPWVPPLHPAGANEASAAAARVPLSSTTEGAGAAVLPSEPPSAPLEMGSPVTPRPTRAGAGGTGISGLPGAGASSGAQEGHREGAAPPARSAVARPAMSSSIAQSLRDVPASFGGRVEADARNGSAGAFAPEEGVRRADEEQEGVLDEEAEGEDDDEDEDDDGTFVPPHLVVERRERKDERYLSRSIGPKR